MNPCGHFAILYISELSLYLGCFEYLMPLVLKRKKLFLGLIIGVLGLIGVFSMLTVDMPLPPEAEALLKSQFSDFQISLMLLVNPIILLLIAVLTGIALYEKVHFTVPILENLTGVKSSVIDFYGIVGYGILGGVLSGLSISLLGWMFESIIPEAMKTLSESVKLSPAARFLYGGITEEILMRFGLMTLLAWLASLIFKGTPAAVYWLAIVASALIFAIGHFPLVFQTVSSPDMFLLLYILTGNALGGIVFGWLYWKKGLESAMLAHIFAHVAMLSFS